MSEFTIAGLVYNLSTVLELLNDAQTCYEIEGLEELAGSLLETSIYMVDRTRERAMTKEDKKVE